MKCRKLLCLLVLVAICLAGCSGTQKQYTVTFLDLFDTVTTVTHLGGSQTQFDEDSKAIRAELERYHRLFDIYNDYPGVNNLKTVNDQAGIAPVLVDSAIIDLLLSCKAYYELTGGRVDVTMGSVLQLWHEARTAGQSDPQNAKLPDAAALEEAARHRGFEHLVIDEGKGTVYIQDPQMSLDVGAVAKGWSAQRVAENAPEGYLISVGGNVCATGPKQTDGTPWKVAIQHPDGGGYLHTIALRGGCVVTSGDYQRTYMVDGLPYHHIIDPDTRMPATLWRSVTIVCDDSAMADALSTALFLQPLDQGRALLDQCGGEAVWVAADGKVYYSDGFEEMILS
jgi:thiamine biosynthesis lipoprotein